MAYVIKIESEEDENTFYIRVDPDTKQVEYVSSTYEATRFDTLTELDEAQQYCHIHGFDIEKVE